MEFAKRVAKIKPSATLLIAAKANALRAEGRDVIGFGAGEPDFDTPSNIKKAAIDAIEKGFTKYTPVGGTNELRDTIVDKLERENHLSYRRSEIVVSCGAKHSLYNIAQVLFDRGDEVIIPAPYWVSYPDIVLLADATPVFIYAEKKNGFKITAEQLKKAITGKTKALILNSPSNPTGAAYSLPELEELAAVLSDRKIVVISDDIYEKVIYDNFSFFNIANVSSKMKERTIVVNGVSKSYAMTGWRIGYAAGSEEIISRVAKIQSQSTSSPVSISQKAAVEAIRGDQKATRKMAEEFAKRKDYIIDGLKSIPEITCLKPLGTFYAFPDFSSVYGRSYGGRTIEDSTSLASYLLDEANVAVVPGVAFGNDNHIRLSYATSMENIEKGIARIKEAIEILS
ncbi:MAG: pyridoxal phosphate-dependent aminotransferase [Thermodesulfobacteriota bacterium]|nr:pyridoxal phosphate-dependent aminotransferase [Thermodesulfobacteriota bacterium]